METVENIFKGINDFRFTTLIKYEKPFIPTYDLVKNEYFDNPKFKKAVSEYYGREEQPIGVCQLCENKNANISGDKNFSLKIVSHGIQSLDLFKKQGFTDYSDYREDGIMLIMESPSSNLDACYEMDFSSKHPAKVWWWLENENTDKPETYPDEFKGRKYGQFFNSFVHTFKLKNAYMTNFIKCGMLDDSDLKFGNFATFPDECKRTCFENILLKEIEIINPKVIFTFSTNVYKYIEKQIEEINKKMKSTPIIVQLPHPARSRQGFLNEYYRTLWYCRSLEGLINAKVIQNKNEQHKYWDMYVENNDDK